MTDLAAPHRVGLEAAVQDQLLAEHGLHHLRAGPALHPRPVLVERDTGFEMSSV